MAGSKNSTKTSNGSNKTGGKGKGKEGKKDAGGEGGSEGAKEGSGGKLKPATAINSRHILVSFLSFSPKKEDEEETLAPKKRSGLHDNKRGALEMIVVRETREKRGSRRKTAPGLQIRRRRKGVLRG